MPRRVADFYPPSAYVDYIPVPQNPRWLSLKQLIAADIIAFRQITPVNDHAPNRLHGEREAAGQPVQLLLMGAELRKIFMPADVVPVDMGGHSRDRPVRQLFHFLMDVAEPFSPTFS